MFGALRYLHTVHNYESGGELSMVYYFFGNVFFETDITVLQTFIPLVDSDKLFELLLKNFFWYDV